MERYVDLRPETRYKGCKVYSRFKEIFVLYFAYISKTKKHKDFAFGTITSPWGLLQLYQKGFKNLYLFKRYKQNNT